MHTINTIAKLKKLLNKWHLQKYSITFIPTMGGLHKGHISLLNTAKQKRSKTIVSIFINPVQFSAHEDFKQYPRTLEKDKSLLLANKIDAVFIPSVAQIYPYDFVQINYDIGNINAILCGKTRPHFFNGVVQIMHRLFDIIKPNVVVLGEKDYQQLLIIKQMINKLSLDITIVSHPIVRHNSGLAMSTRNQYLSTSDKLIAANFYKILFDIKEKYLTEITIDSLKEQAKKRLKEFFELDYIEFLDANNLLQITNNTSKIIVISAVFLKSIRLIDNVKFRR